MGCCLEHEFVNQLSIQTTFSDSQADYYMEWLFPRVQVHGRIQDFEKGGVHECTPLIMYPEATIQLYTCIYLDLEQSDYSRLTNQSLIRKHSPKTDNFSNI